MSVWGVCMARNEADIIGPVVAHMVTQVDHVLLADNLSTDGTGDLARDAGAEVIVDDDPAYWQSRKMTALARRAAEHGAEWVVPFDSDEIWYCPHAATIADHLTGLDRYSIAEAELYDHVPTTEDDQSDTNPTTRIGWRRRDRGALRKVACRTHDDLVIEQGNHGANYGRWKGRAAHRQLVVRHFPYRTADQFVAKAKQGGAAVALTDLPEQSGAHWRQYAAIAAGDGDDALAAVFAQWFHSAAPRTDPTLIYDPAPVT